MKKLFYSLSFLLLIVATSYSQNVLIGPGYSQVQNTSSGQPLSIGMRSGSTGYFDFRRGSSYSAGVVNTNSPKQLRIGIANSNNGVDYYNDIVIDSTNRRIGFGTNNPTNRWHYYSVGGSSDDILVEGDDYPFLILKSKIGAANEGILFKSSNDNNIGILYHSGADKTMRWGFGGFTNDVVIDSTTRNVGFGTSTPSSKLHTLNDRVTSSVQNIKVEQTGSAYYAALGLFNASGGTIIYGRPTGGLEVVNSSNTYAPVYASAFTVSSDIAAKKEIDYLGNDDYDEYITQIRNIQSATYRYNWENVRTRTTPHIGFIAQSLPSAVTAEMSVNSGSSDGQTYVGYNLADMAGLTVMGIKAVDARTLKLDETIKAQQAQIDILIKEIEKLKK